MARFKPTILNSTRERSSLWAFDILDKPTQYGVLYKGQLFSLRRTHVARDLYKYKNMIFPTKKSAINISERLNELFNTTDFTVCAIVPALNS